MSATATADHALPREEMSLAELLATSGELDGFLEALSEEEARALEFEWSFFARPKQLWPGGHDGGRCGPAHGCAHEADEWTTWAIIAGRGFGKEIDVDEYVPTPSGSTTIGKIEVGDTLYNRRGVTCQVTAVHPIRTTLDCYRLTFSDGVSIVASGSHRWVTRSAVERKRLAKRGGALGRQTRARGGHNRIDVYESVRTTDELRATLYASDGRSRNHSIDNTAPYDPPEVDLPVDPYTLGAWLGDGTTRDGTVSSADPEIVERLNDVHTATQIATDRRGGPCVLVRVEGLKSRLADAGVLGHKHIPMAYLRASYKQRLELLRGLMDTDGTIGKNGYCAFAVCVKELADDMYELLCSLGMSVRRRQRPAKYVLDGVTTVTGSTSYELWFAPTVNPFHLQRKADRVRMDRSQFSRRTRRYLVSVEPVPTLPVRCITVDSPDHTFLVGHSHLPTHNTWTGAQATRRVAEQGKVGLIHLIAPTPADYRDVMIEGPAGIQAVSPRWSRPEWFPSKRLLIWPNGVRGLAFSAEDPEALRGPQCGWLWGDEPGAWTYGQETWDQAQFGLRLGANPKQIITTTPKPFEWLEDIVFDDKTHLTQGSTYENLQNLAKTFARTIIKKYEGTNLGRQELLAEFLHAVEGALWTPELLEKTRRHIAPSNRTKAAVAVDPNVSSKAGSDECGIVSGFVADGELYVERDLTLPHPTPDQWARRAVQEYHRINADSIVAEVNNGGDLVAHTIRTVDRNVNVKVVHASRGKAIRAEPVAALFEQDRAHILRTLPELEDQMCKWVPGVTKKSPDRVDAMVWLGTYLMIDGGRNRARLIA